MNQDRYQYSTNQNFLDFEFESEGPNGRIKKVVRFSPQNAGAVTLLNLSFGHWNEATKELDDKAMSNNRDRPKILATVAATVMEFTEHFPDMPVFAQGSNLARTRLYQMGISRNLDEIEMILDIYGLNKGQWERFQKNANYEAFVAHRKGKYVTLYS